MRSVYLLFITIITFNLVQALSKIRLNKAGNFVDMQDRVLVFHGFNSVAKSPPYYFEEALNETRLKLFQDWGFNVIRLGVIWSGLMPAKDVINETYLDVMERIIDLSNKYGLYIILDMHQDGLSTRFGSYDAIPLWLIDELKASPSIVKYPFPFWTPPSARDWFLNYFTFACEHAAQQMYTNESATWNHWAKFWTTLAKKFGNKPNVLGYELINEPPPGNFYTFLLRLLPGYSGSKNLQPVYDFLANQIHQHDSDGLIFYEPLTYFSLLGSLMPFSGTGFTHVPGAVKDPDATQKGVLSYHYYCFLLQLDDPSKDLPAWKKYLCKNLFLDPVFEGSLKSIQKTGGGRFLTEFGLCAPDGNERSINTMECDAVLNMADEHLQSWTYWDSYFFDNQQNPIMTQVLAFSRTYPRATAGIPILMRFDRITGNFYYSFTTEDTDLEQNAFLTEVFAPMDIHYPEGVQIVTSPDGITSEIQGNLIIFRTPQGGLTNKTMVKIKISRHK